MAPTGVSVGRKKELTMRTGILILAGLMVVGSAGAVLAQDAAGGQTAFQRWCLPCHSAGEGATIKLGPPLNGLNGRPAGTWAGYSYSDAMKNSGITWGEAVFKEYVAAPLQKVPGTRMAFTGVKDPKEVNDLWAYLSAFDKDGNKK
jgi:cytochrome c